MKNKAGTGKITGQRPFIRQSCAKPHTWQSHAEGGFPLLTIHLFYRLNKVKATGSHCFF
jgi:hypothetical protein